MNDSCPYLAYPIYTTCEAHHYIETQTATPVKWIKDFIGAAYACLGELPVEHNTYKAIDHMDLSVNIDRENDRIDVYLNSEDPDDRGRTHFYLRCDHHQEVVH